MSVMDKIKDILTRTDDIYEYEEVEEVEEQIERKREVGGYSNNKIVPLSGGAASNKQELLNLTMSNYEMTGELCGYIKEKKPIVVNMQKLTPVEVQRAIDYLSGACDALDGSVEKVAENIFIFAPEHIALNKEQMSKVKQKAVWSKL